MIPQKQIRIRNKNKIEKKTTKTKKISILFNSSMNESSFFIHEKKK
jgi:hypothetical protein